MVATSEVGGSKRKSEASGRGGAAAGDGKKPFGSSGSLHSAPLDRSGWSPGAVLFVALQDYYPRVFGQEP